MCTLLLTAMARAVARGSVYSLEAQPEHLQTTRERSGWKRRPIQPTHHKVVSQR